VNKKFVKTKQMQSTVCFPEFYFYDVKP